MKTKAKLLTGALLMAAIINMFAQPIINTQPNSQAVEARANVTFRVIASGILPATYQWRQNGTELPGANAGTLTLRDVQNANVGKYTALVTDSNGSSTSEPARLSVHAPTLLLTITNQWKFNQSRDDSGTSWKEAGFDDSNWPEGEALFHNETRTLPEPKNTFLALTNAAAQPLVTYYFRAHFNFTGSNHAFQLAPVIPLGTLGRGE